MRGETSIGTWCSRTTLLSIITDSNRIEHNNRYVGKWKGCRVRTILGEPLAMELSGASTRSGETSSNLALRFKSAKQQELVLHILREAGVEIDVKFLKYLRHRPSHLSRH